MTDHAPARRYFDNAATSFPKPSCVHEAMAWYLREVGASPGRGHYAQAREGAAVIRGCRERLARLLGGASPDHVIFTLNTSDALNLAIKGAVRAARLRSPERAVHLVTTASDHNSVLRPFHALREEGVRTTCVPVDPSTGVVDPGDVARAITPETVLVAVVHASNVTGVLQPIGAIGAACRERDVLFLVDAAQSAGHVEIDASATGVDLLAFPGHKGLLGPQGTGGLLLRPGVESRVATTREGGTGSVHEFDEHPSAMPMRYEAGSHNAMGLAGLSAAAGWLLERGVHELARHERALRVRMLQGLEACAAHGLRLLGPGGPDGRVGVFSVVHDRLGPGAIARQLEERAGVLVRSGIHCAPLMHRTLGTLEGGPERQGACRLSLGPFLSVEDVGHACAALGEICREAGRATSVVSVTGTPACA